MTTKHIQPLQAVMNVTVSEKRGKDLNPYYFWMAREFTLHLQCGHTDIRARDVYGRSVVTGADLSVEGIIASMPKRIRCKTCPPKTITSRPKSKTPDPEYDPLVVALAMAARHADPNTETEMLTWLADNGRFVADPDARDRAHRAVIVELVDRYAEDAHPVHAPVATAAVHAWAADPTEENRQAARKLVRRLYSAQHSDGKWFANRGFVAAAACMAPAGRPTRVLEAITWDAETRAPFYANLLAERTLADANAAAGLATAAGDHISEVDRLLREEWPTISTSHIPAVRHLLETYHQATAPVGGLRHRDGCVALPEQ